MKSSGKPGGQGDGKQPKNARAANRKQFLQTAGAAAAGAAGLDAAFIKSAFGATAVVQAVPPAEVRAILKTAAERTQHAEQFATIQRSLASLGLRPVPEIARAYRVVGAVTGAQKTITVLPFHPASRSAQIVGGVGFSDATAPSAVSVRLDGTRVVTYTTHDVLAGKLVVKTFTPAQLMSGVGRFVERDLPREAVRPDVTIVASANIAEQTFRTLLAGEEQRGIYSPAQVRGFLTNTPSMRLMAQLQYARHRGLTMSPGNPCCCCSCCCWGCCSCTSAVASSYLSERYRSRAATRRIGA